MCCCASVKASPRGQMMQINFALLLWTCVCISDYPPTSIAPALYAESCHKDMGSDRPAAMANSARQMGRKWNVKNDFFPPTKQGRRRRPHCCCTPRLPLLWIQQIPGSSCIPASIVVFPSARVEQQATDRPSNQATDRPPTAIIV